MASLLTNLENNEAVLLMYLANELPADDRAEVESLLQSDPHFRSQLEELHASYAALDSAIGQADASLHLSSGFSSARDFGEAVRKRHEAQANSRAKELVPHHRQIWWYPVATAAIVAIGMSIWWYVASSQEMRSIDPPAYTSEWTPENPESAYVSRMFTPVPEDTNQSELRRELEVVKYLRTETLW